ncbi:MAG TPA: hypothetical protein PKA28_13785 [Methylomusa anaerophila]|nr:hypothetical protein [Methylomusa anaerophila]HML89508.1 hypothetical protein [Methylomusa anaerophila]
MKVIWILAVASFFMSVPASHAYAAQSTQDEVAAITVSITAVKPPPVRIVKRMSASVATVGEQMFLGRSVTDLETNSQSYSQLIKEIFDRVLVGYSVERVSISPGPTTHIAVNVTPWGDVVQDVALEIDFGRLSPELTDIIKQDMGSIEEKINDVLIGLPVDAVDWAGGVSKSVIREILADQLPEFKANLDIIAGQRTVVKLSLIPAGATVQAVNVSFRSHTIPQLLLLEAKPVVEKEVAVMRGLPVAFLERHRDYFTNTISSYAERQPLVKRYGVTITPVINPGEDTQVILQAETTKYRISLEGNLDIGRLQDNTSAKLHAGVFLNKKDEAFLEVSFLPSSVTWEFEPGWGHRLSSQTTAGFRYNFAHGQAKVWMTQDIGRNWSLRLERTPESGANEFAVRYKLHELLSAEYVFTNQENWLRLVGNL